MPVQREVGTAFATAIATPARLRLVAALTDGARTGADLATALGTDVQSVARSALPLERLGLVTRTAGSARRRVYTLVREPFFSDEALDALPVAARRATIAAVLTQLHARTTAAVDAAGFDRREVHLTRSTLELSERAWREASAVLMETYDRLQQLAAEDAEEPALSATAVMMLFTAGSEARDHREPHSPRELAEDEAVEAGTALVERLEEMITSERTPWESIVAVVDELRVVARAGMIEESRRPAPALSAPEHRRPT